MREESSHNVKQSWGAILDYVLTTGSVIVNRWGRPIAVIVSYDKFLEYEKENQNENRSDVD